MRAGDIIHLPRIHKALDSIPNTTKEEKNALWKKKKRIICFDTNEETETEGIKC